MKLYIREGNAVLKMGKFGVVSEIVHFIAEKILEVCIEKGKTQYDIRKRDNKLHRYLGCLEQELLLKYDNSGLYEELYHVIKESDSLEKLLAFAQNQDTQEWTVTAHQMILEMTEKCSDVYLRAQINEILQKIYQDAFAYFNNIDNDDLFKLKNHLEREGREIRQKMDAQSKMQKEISLMIQGDMLQDKKISEEITFGPPKPVAHFLGRKTEMRDIEAIIEKNMQDHERVACWIYGMGGLGKTQLCRKLYIKLRNHFSYIGWIPYQGDFRTSLVESLYWSEEKKSGENLEQRYRNALKYLQQLGTEALLFIDNYDDIEDCRADIERLSCHVIISSRSKNPDMFLGYPLGFLSLRECKKIFCNFYTLQEEEEAILNEVIHLAGYLTIAVELLAKTARKQNLTLLELYEVLQSRSFDIHTVIQSNWDNPGEALQEELTRHFEIIFDMTSIRRDIRKVRILQNFSILPYLSIEHREATEWLALERETSLLADLYESGWLEQSEDCKYSMHPLISYTVKKNDPPRVTDCLHLIQSLADRIHANEECDYLEIFTYLPYADAVGKYFRSRKSDTNMVLCRLFCELAVAYEINGEYSIGYAWGQNAICYMKQLHDVDVEFPNMIYNTMAEICLDMRNRDKECKEWSQKAVAYDEEHEGMISEILCSNSFHNLACAYIQLMDNDQAIKYEEMALKLRQKNFPEGHVKVLNVLRNLAMVYRREGSVVEAFNTQRKVIKYLQKLYSNQPKHPAFPVAYSIYSFILRDLNNLEGAIRYQMAATRIREHNNKNDPKLAINYNNLGVFLREYGNLEQAEYWQNKAIEMDLQLRGPNHIDLATDYYNYALILYEKQDYSQALFYLNEAWKIEDQAENGNTADIEELAQKIKGILHDR